MLPEGYVFAGYILVHLISRWLQLSTLNRSSDISAYKINHTIACEIKIFLVYKYTW